jgi:hypothetical protein
MQKRPLPPTGGGAPDVVAAGTVLPSTIRGPPSPLTLTLTVSSDAEAAGSAVIELVREACVQGDLDEVATLRFFFGSITERAPEFHVLMDGLVDAGDTASVQRIMRDPGSPGRPRDNLTYVALIEQIMAEHVGWSAAETWLPPEREPWRVQFFATAVVTRLPSGAVVIHSPNNTVTQGVPYV